MATQFAERTDAADALQNIDGDLSRSVSDNERLAVLGKGDPAAQENAYNLLKEYGSVKGWSADKADTEQAHLASRLANPDPATYHTWLNTFANNAIKQREAGESAAALEARKNAFTCLDNLAASRSWDTKKHALEKTKLRNFIETGAPEPEKQNRFNKLTAAIGASSLLGAYAKINASRYARQRAAAHEREKDDKEKSHKKAVLIGVGAVAVVAAGAVGILYGFDVLGHGRDVHQQLADLPRPKAPSSNDLLSQKPNLPSNNDVVQGPHLRGRESAGSAQVQRHAETLNRHFDTIWSHASNLLGKKATNQSIANYTHKILHANHLTEFQAKRLPVNYKFIIPSYK